MINKVILVGNVGKDPEVRYLEKNVAVARFSLATSERAYTNAKGVLVPEKTEWHNIVVWRGLAEVVQVFLCLILTYVIREGLRAQGSVNIGILGGIAGGHDTIFKIKILFVEHASYLLTSAF